MKETYLPAIFASYAKDADVLAAMVGNYQSNTQNIQGKVQLGSAWCSVITSVEWNVR